MFQIGFWELIVVIVVAFWVFGPQQLSIVGRLAGRWISRGKKILNVIQIDIKEELENKNDPRLR